MLPPYLSEYDSAWPDHFDQIRSFLIQGLDARARIEHVGSTAIPHMVAKPVIDLDVIVRPEDMPCTIVAIEKLGYEHEGDKGLKGREAFKPIPGSYAAQLPTHHLYGCELGGIELQKHLLFRDYLRAHPAEAAWMSDKKRHLGSTLLLSKAEYIERKSIYVERIMKAARAWRSRT